MPYIYAMSLVLNIYTANLMLQNNNVIDNHTSLTRPTRMTCRPKTSILIYIHN